MKQTSVVDFINSSLTHEYMQVTLGHNYCSVSTCGQVLHMHMDRSAQPIQTEQNCSQNVAVELQNI